MGGVFTSPSGRAGGRGEPAVRPPCRLQLQPAASSAGRPDGRQALQTAQQKSGQTESFSIPTNRFDIVFLTLFFPGGVSTEDYERRRQEVT